MQETIADRAQGDDVVWQKLQDAILQERFDDLPELMSAMDFAEFAAEPIELIRDAIGNGDIVATKHDGLVAIPKGANERLIRYRLREHPSARVVSRPAASNVRRLSTPVDPGVFELVVNRVASTGASMRQVVEEALVAHWGADDDDRAPTDRDAGRLPTRRAPEFT